MEHPGTVYVVGVVVAEVLEAARMAATEDDHAALENPEEVLRFVSLHHADLNTRKQGT